MRTVRIHARGVKIRLADQAAKKKGPVWIQICREGLFKGYSAGEVNFSREMFTTIVANLHAHPSFEPGPDGKGIAPVVPYDYEHASEMDPTKGTIPINGAPAPAWVLDLEIRDDTEGKAELWALSQLGEKIRAQLTADPPEYQWTSVAIDPEAVDPESAAEVGPVLTSVAFTNHPFVQGMAAAVAASSKGERILADYDVWGQADSPEEAILGLRKAFGLEATADAAMITEHLNRFGQFIANGTFPMGVDGEYMLRRLRDLFGLPALASWDEIYTGAVSFLGGVVSEGDNAPAPGGAAGDPEMKTLPQQLATILKSRDTDDSIVLAAKQTVEKADAFDRLKELFGSPDTQGVLADAASMVTKSKQFEGFITALGEASKSLQTDPQANDAATETEIEEEAKVAASACKLDADLLVKAIPVFKLAARAVREHVLARHEAELVVAGLAAKDKAMAEQVKPIIVASRIDAIGSKEKLAAFRTRFPLPDAQRQLLTTRIFAGPGGTQMGGVSTGAPAPGVLPSAPAPDGGVSHELPAHVQACTGRNATEKAQSYLCAKRPGFEKLPRIVQIQQAGAYIQEGAPAL